MSLCFGSVGPVVVCRFWLAVKGKKFCFALGLDRLSSITNTLLLRSGFYTWKRANASAGSIERQDRLVVRRLAMLQHLLLRNSRDVYTAVFHRWVAAIRHQHLHEYVLHVNRIKSMETPAAARIQRWYRKRVWVIQLVAGLRSFLVRATDPQSMQVSTSPFSKTGLELCPTRRRAALLTVGAGRDGQHTIPQERAPVTHPDRPQLGSPLLLLGRLQERL